MAVISTVVTQLGTALDGRAMISLTHTLTGGEVRREEFTLASGTDANAFATSRAAVLADELAGAEFEQLIGNGA